MAGWHQLKVSKLGYVTVKQSVDLSQHKIIRVRLEKTSHDEIDPEMVLVSAGSFLRGSDSDDPDEVPTHQITLDTFYIGKYEVTQKQW